jgi:GT2 family glycosyltransferase
MISIIIPTYKGREEKLEKLLATIPDSYEIIIMDGEESLATKRNKGAKEANHEVLVFIDDDNELHPYALRRIEGIFKMRSDIGILGLMATYDEDRNKVCDGGSFRNFTTGFTTDKYVNKKYTEAPDIYEVDEVANAFAIKRKIFNAFGGFDAESFPIDLDEADLCARIKKARYKVLMARNCRVFHKSITYSRLPNLRRAKNAYYVARNKILFQKKHGKSLVLYYLLFMPLTIVLYSLVFVYRLQLEYLKYFYKGVIDGIGNRKRH